MSRNTGGNYSLPTGNPVVSGTTITNTWANGTLGDLASEMTDSLNRSGKGAMLAPLKIVDGTAAAPALTWAADPDSGIYRAGDGDVRMQVDATQTQKWTTTGVTIPVALTASGGITATGTSSVTGAVTINTTVAPVSNSGAAGFQLKPGSLDHVYLEFYADTAAPSTRSGYIGYPDAGGSELTLENQMTGGDLRVTSPGSVIVGTQQLKMNGSAPSSSTAITNALTSKNIVKAWALISVPGGGSTSATITDGFNVSGASVSGSTVTLSIASTINLAGVAFVDAATGAGIQVIGRGVVTASNTVLITCRNLGSAPPTSFDIQASAATTTIQVMVLGAQ